MKKLLLLFGLCSLGLAFFFLHQYRNQRKKDESVLHIAICTPASHPALEEVERGFKEVLQKDKKHTYLFTTFNANGNKTLMRAQAEEVVQGDYDLIFTMGALFSQTVAGLLHKMGIKTPHVFGAVDGLALAQSLMNANEYSTGAYVQLDYRRNVDTLLQVKPTIHNILLVYDPTHGAGLEKEKNMIQQYAAQKGVTVDAVELYQPNEIQQKVAALIPSYDVVLVLVDNTVVSGIDTLITLCNRYGVTLYASDLNSGKKGAALAFGIYEYESGHYAADKAHEILINGKKPHKLPATAVDRFRLMLNEETADAQSVDKAAYRAVVHKEGS